MTLIKAIIFGIIQGLTEFLPVSSSGHLALSQNILGLENPDELVAFNVLLHLGTFIAVLAVYWKDVFPLIPAFFTMIGKVFKGKLKMSEYTYNERFIILLIVATLPLIPASFLEDLTAPISAYLFAVGIVLIINGGVLLLSDKLSRGNMTISEATPKKALFIGLFQALAALFPGLSRSGSTITGGLLSGFDRQSAVKFSFIMSLPAIAGACVLKLPELFESASGTEELLIYAAGALSAAVVGFLAIKLLSYISKKSNFRGFAFYCIAAGLVAVVWDIIRMI